MGIEQGIGYQPVEADEVTTPEVSTVKTETETSDLMTIQVEHVAYVPQHNAYVVTVEPNKSYYVRNFTDKSGNELTADQISKFNNKPANERARVALTLVEQGEDKRPENDIYTAEV